MALRLITGPANAGKTGVVLDAFLASLDAGEAPWLLAPTRTDAARLQRELVDRRGSVIGARFGTLDAVARQVLARAGALPGRWLGSIEKRVALRSLAHSAGLDALAESSRTGGFADAVSAMVDGLAQAGTDPADLLDATKAMGDADPVAREAARLYAAYRAFLDETGASDAVHAAAAAARILRSHETPDAVWPKEPVFLNGFDDISRVELSLIEGLAGACQVTVSVTWVDGRAALEGVEDVARSLLAIADSHDEVRAEEGTYRGVVLGALEASLFDGPADGRVPLDELSLGVLTAAGPRAEVELAASEVSRSVRSGVPADDVAVVARSLDGYQAYIQQVFDSSRIPYDMEYVRPLASVPLGRALLGLVRFGVGGDRDELSRLVVSPFSGVGPTVASSFDALVRGRGIGDGRYAAKVLKARLAEDGELSGSALVRWLDATPIRDAHGLLRLVEEATSEMIVHAFGRGVADLDEAGGVDVAAAGAVREAVAEMRRLAATGDAMKPVEIIAALERVEVRSGGEGRPGRVQVLTALRARGRRFHTVIVLGLNEGSFPLTPREDPFFSPRSAGFLAERGVPVPEPPGQAWERYLFYTVATRARSRLVLSYQTASADGSPRTRSFYVDDVEALVTPGAGEDPEGDDGASGGALRAVTRSKGLSSPTFASPEDAPGASEHRRALAAGLMECVRTLRPADEQAIEALAPDWLADSARLAQDLPPSLTGVAARELAGRSLFSATQLESYARCPLRWFVEHELAPTDLDRELGPLQRGAVIHKVLESLADRLADDRFGVDAAFTEECREHALETLGQAIGRAAGAMEGVAVETARRAAERQLEDFLDMQGDRRGPYRPASFELRFGGDDEGPLDLGDDVAIRGRVDRVDAAEGGAVFVIDYKSGKSVPSPKEIVDEEHLQIPLYCLAWDAVLGPRLGDEGSRAVAGAYWILGTSRLTGIFDAATRSTARRSVCPRRGA